MGRGVGVCKDRNEQYIPLIIIDVERKPCTVPKPFDLHEPYRPVPQPTNEKVNKNINIVQFGSKRGSIVLNYGNLLQCVERSLLPLATISISNHVRLLLRLYGKEITERLKKGPV